MAVNADTGDGFVGRAAEIAALRNAVAVLATGQGGVAWIEGDPGIGKSSLVRQALLDAAVAGCTLYATAADPLRQGFPLAVMRDCLRIDRGANDTSRDAIARLLRGDRADGLVPGGNAVMAAGDLMCELVEKECAARPVIVVVDDLQWADEASVSVWHRLVRQSHSSPLLVVGVARALPRTWVVAYARGTVKDASDSTWLPLGPLPDDDVTTLITKLLGAPPSPELRRLAEQAAGSPLYIRELIDALRRENRLKLVGGVVEVTAGDSRRAGQPQSLAAVIEDRLGFLSERTLESLRHAALLGERFAVTDVAVVQGCPVRDLVGVIREAVAAGVLTASGVELAFRHALIREALVDALPPGLRAALHSEAARALAEADAPQVKVIAQLLAAASLAADGAFDAWSVGWVATAAPTLVHRSPVLAAELLERALPAASGPDWEVLAEASASAHLLLGRYDLAAGTARRLLAVTGDQRRRLGVTWTLGCALARTGNNAQASALVEGALAAQAMPPDWRARLVALRSLILALAQHDEEAAVVADAALAEAEAADDRFASAYALHVRFGIAVRAGDGAMALEYAEQALAVMGDDAELTDLRLLQLASRLTLLTLQGRDVQADAGRLMSLAEQAGSCRAATIRAAIAQSEFLAGRWDEALVTLQPMLSPGFTAEPEDLAEGYGLAAMIAVHRDDQARADAHLDAAGQLPPLRGDGTVRFGWALRARAVRAERAGQGDESAAVLAGLSGPSKVGSDILRGGWSPLPDLARLAVAAGDLATAREVADEAAALATAAAQLAVARAACASEYVGAARRAAAVAARCRGIADSDPGPLEEAVVAYREFGQPLTLAHALEDLAVARGARDDLSGARLALREAVDIYLGLDAKWDIVRADARTRTLGVRRRRSGTKRPDTGWDALTPTELTVAELVTEGLTNPEIGERLFVSFRTVRFHVSSIMAKLGVRSRVEIAREVARHREYE